MRLSAFVDGREAGDAGIADDCYEIRREGFHVGIVTPQKRFASYAYTSRSKIVS
jgi:hypothetical protein